MRQDSGWHLFIGVVNAKKLKSIRVQLAHACRIHSQHEFKIRFGSSMDSVFTSHAFIKRAAVGFQRGFQRVVKDASPEQA